MKKILIYSLLLLSSLCYFTNCVDTLVETPKTFEKDYEYFPLQVGKYIIYEVDSITYRQRNSALVQDSVHFQAKEEIIDTLLDNLGVLNYKIEYYERKDASQPWQVKKVWRTERSERQAIRNEEGFRSLKLTFPIAKKQTWDETIYIDNQVEVTIGEQPIAAFKDWREMQVLDLAKAEQVGSKKFDDVLSVASRATASGAAVNQAEFRQLDEKYARGVGLVSKSLQVLDTQCKGGKFEMCVGVPWVTKAERGFRLRWTVKEYN